MNQRNVGKVSSQIIGKNKEEDENKRMDVCTRPSIAYTTMVGRTWRLRSCYIDEFIYREFERRTQNQSRIRRVWLTSPLPFEGYVNL